MNDENQINYYAIIPATVRYDTRLKSSEKLMYGEITALANKNGYCFASNKYFAELYNVTIHTVSQWISKLTKLGYVYVEIIRNAKNEVMERRIYIIDYPNVQINTYPYVLKCKYPRYKKVQENNIKNNIDRLFSFIINNKTKIPEELIGIDMNEVYKVLRKFEMLYNEEMIKNYSVQNIEKIKFIIYALINIIKIGKKDLLNKITRNELSSLYDRCKINEDEINNFYEYYFKCVLNKIDKP